MVRFYLHAVVSLLVAALPLGLADVTSALSLSSSKWIWNSVTATAGAQVAQRKVLTPPLGKSLVAAEIIISSYINFQLYVNGDYIGTGNRPSFGHRFCVDLLPSYNVFAVNGSTTVSGSDDGGLVATILVTYTDGTTDTVVTDSSWRTMVPPPPEWETLCFDDTAWPAATVVGSYGVSPWQNVVVALPADPPVVTLTNAVWIWTSPVPAGGAVPVGSRAFRRTFIPDPNQVPASATIIMAADNEYTLYLNGVTVGSGSNWPDAQRYTINFASAPSELVLAVLATNAGGPAGVLMSMEINMVPRGRNNCTAGVFLTTDGLWKSTEGAIPAGFEQPDYDDSTWPAVGSQGAYGIAPWATLTITPVPTPVTI
ncbi:lectin [Mycena alexandri]|uniref:Lectin n=1 Tax=Mycena alexandri TaxID=1745969 RepID=A0AAD6TET8_9AGAR|nr:lectin [Mycena alexandri]